MSVSDEPGSSGLFPQAFELFEFHGDRGRICGRIGGSGPALLLLHGYPQTHVMWHPIAEALATQFSVILPDLPGTEGLRAFLSVEPGADMSRLLAEARIALLALGGESVVPRRFLFADTLPRNQNGKADRRACVRMVEEGKFRRQARAAQADEAHL